MTFDNPSPVTELTQELRLATTMSGGVSLAIWMAGVAREINLLAQASQWRREGGAFPADSSLSRASASSLRLYAGLIDLLDMIVDVDILSGTSAGGINAALLASSRTSGADLGGLRDLWLDLGALTDLLRDPRDKHTPSLLYGDERMFAALAMVIWFSSAAGINTSRSRANSCSLVMGSPPVKPATVLFRREYSMSVGTSSPAGL